MQEANGSAAGGTAARMAPAFGFKLRCQVPGRRLVSQAAGRLALDPGVERLDVR